MERFDSCFHPHHACEPHPDEYHENIHYTPGQINALLGLIPYKADRAEVPRMETLSDVNYIGHVATPEVLPERMEQPSWALVGSVKETKPYFYYVEGFVPKGYQAGWNDLSGVLGTYDLTADKVSIYDFNLVTEYNVSNNHTHTAKVYSGSWERILYSNHYPLYIDAKEYRRGDTVNVAGCTSNSFRARCCSQGIDPYKEEETNAYTFSEAVDAVPEDYRIPGMRVTFICRLSGRVYTYFFESGDVSLWNDRDSWIRVDYRAERNVLDSREKFRKRFEFPTLVAERAVSDEFGQRFTQEYVTRTAIVNYIKYVFTSLFNNNPPPILDGMITPGMLSETVLEMVGFGHITNCPDDEFLGVRNSRVTLKNRCYDPNNFSGKGIKWLRKNIVDGVNVLTDKCDMITCPHTIYVIQYDYDLNGQTLEMPEGCTLLFLTGSIRNGTVNLNGTRLLPQGMNPAGHMTDVELEGTYAEGQALYDGTLKRMKLYNGEYFVNMDGSALPDTANQEV